MIVTQRCSVFTLTEHLSMLCAPSHSLQITGPAQGPRVDKPHLASIARIRPAVTGRALKGIAKVVRNSSGVADWHNRKFTQEMLDGNNIKNRILWSSS